MILLKIQHIIHTYRQSSSSEKAVTTGPSTITPKFLLPKSASTADGVSTSQLTDPPDPVPLPCARISIILQAMWSSGMHLFIISPHDSAGWVFLKNLSDLLHVRHSKVTQSHRWSMAVAMLMMIAHISAHG